MNYLYSEKERNQVITNFMKDGRVIHIPSKEKKKYILLHDFIKGLDKERIYTEQEINTELLKRYSASDYVEQRRYLITFGLLKRTADGAQYWLNLANHQSIEE